MVIAPALGEVVSASGGRYSEQNEAPQSKLFGAPSRKKFWAPQEGYQSKFLTILYFIEV